MWWFPRQWVTQRHMPVPTNSEEADEEGHEIELTEVETDDTV